MRFTPSGAPSRPALSPFVDGSPQVRTEFAQLTGRLNPPGAQRIDCSKRFVPFPEVGHKL
jgi:hypothetical protein